MTPDVTVYGAGIFGLSCAWALLCRGARVRVVDPAGVGAGASGGVVGALAPHVPERWNAKKAFQLDSLLMAQDWWADVADAGGGNPGYARTGRLQPIVDADARVRAEARDRAARTLWRGAASWRIVPAPAEWGVGSEEAIFDDLSARIHPARACAALAMAIRAGGGEVVDADAPPAGLVLHATGWRGLGDLRDAADRPAGVGIKGQAAVLRLDRADLPQLYLDGLHVVPHADGTVAVGSTTEREFALPDNTDGQLDDVIARAVVAVPELRGAEVVGRWAGVRPRARSRAPLLGAWPGRAGHFVANGGFKIGFGMAPKVAEVMAELMLTGRDAVPEDFSTRALAPGNSYRSSG